MEKSGGPSAAFLQELQNRSGRTLVYAIDAKGNVFASLGWSGDAAEVASVEASENTSAVQNAERLENAVLEGMWATLERVTGCGERERADVVLQLAEASKRLRETQEKLEARSRGSCNVVLFLTVSACRNPTLRGRRRRKSTIVACRNSNCR